MLTTTHLLYLQKNVWYLNGPPSHVTSPFEYPMPIVSGIQTSGTKMVTVLTLSCYNKRSSQLFRFRDSMIFEMRLIRLGTFGRARDQIHPIIIFG